MHMKKKSPGLLGALFSAIFSLLLSISLVLLVIGLFIYGLNENVIMPDAGPISGDWLAAFFDSWYCFVLGGVLVLVPALSILLINRHRIRRFFLAAGCAAIVSVVISIAVSMTGLRMLKLLSGAWQDILVNTTVMFRDFCVVCAMILFVIGAGCLSIYSCIAVVKGGRREKDT